jgi:mannose-6-phosphate isomerase-like protein (cupin superfamily)
MDVHKLSEMTKGWFVGDFEPTLCKTDQFEVAVKYYRAGDHESAHLHKIGTEITVIVSGHARMNGRLLEPGDIVWIAPGEATDFEALTDVATTVVKFPSVKGDKYGA